MSSEEGEVDDDDLFYRKMEKELMYDFRQDAVKRGAPNECVELIRQIHCDHHEQVLSGKTHWRRVKNRGPQPIWYTTILSIAISGFLYGAISEQRIIQDTLNKPHI